MHAAIRGQSEEAIQFAAVQGPPISARTKTSGMISTRVVSTGMISTRVKAASVVSTRVKTTGMISARIEPTRVVSTGVKTASVKSTGVKTSGVEAAKTTTISSAMKSTEAAGKCFALCRRHGEQQGEGNPDRAFHGSIL